MSMIGKISGRDWSKAPKDATHVKLTTFGGVFWYKEGLFWDGGSVWKDSGDWYDSDHKFITKEEDLDLNKTVDDLEVGMFLNWSWYKYLCINKDRLLSIETGTIHTKGDTWNEESLQEAKWSYTYNGEYTPFVKKENPKIAELKATIEQAKKTLEEATKQLEELK